MRKSIFNRFAVGGMLIACVALGAGVLAGCGGGSDSTTTAGASGASGTSGGTALSQDEFVSQANAVCKDVNAKIVALKAPPQGDLSAAADTLDQEIAIITPAISDLSAITPPSDLQSNYTTFVNALKAQVALVTQFASVAKANDTAKAQALAPKIDAASKKNNAVASDLGLTECAKNVSPEG
jgi:hypothetical protein